MKKFKEGEHAKIVIIGKVITFEKFEGELCYKLVDKDGNIFHSYEKYMKKFDKHTGEVIGIRKAWKNKVNSLMKIIGS